MLLPTFCALNKLLAIKIRHRVIIIFFMLCDQLVEVVPNFVKSQDSVTIKYLRILA